MGTEPQSSEGEVSRPLTVAHIRSGPDNGYEVMFLESARIYRLDPDNPMLDHSLDQLRLAKEQHRPVRIRLDSIDSDVIRSVEA